MSLIGRKDRWRISRVVTLPDYQGIGIGMAVAEAVAELHRGEGHRVNVTASHPALWPTAGVRRCGGRCRCEKTGSRRRRSSSRATAARRAGPWCRSSTWEDLGQSQELVAASRVQVSSSTYSTLRWRKRGKRGRRPVLDAAKKREILAIVAVGCSRTAAAAYVGCAISTIQNTADRDPTFAEKLRQAAYATELGLLKNIRNAAEQGAVLAGGGLGAGAALSRALCPPRPDVITLEQVAALLGQFSDIVAEEVPGRFRKRVLKRLEKLAAQPGRSPPREVRR